MRILAVNAGSSSLKLQVLDDDDSQGPARHVEGWDGRDVAPIAELLADGRPVDGIGHRVVHGGTELLTPVVIDDEIVRRLRALVPLAPLHQDRSLAGITAARAAAPDVRQVACFDTAYHATLSDAAATYALPAAWRARWPLRRFGFHGLSHAYAAARATELLGGDASRVVSCHLGAGASLCASLGGRSVDTTMGFTPLEGLVMATRSGSIDPGLVLWLITAAGLSADEVQRGLEHESGLAGLAGSADMRQVIERADAGDEPARLAFEVYVHTLVKHVAGMMATLGGLDALVFTGGVGEHAPALRAAAVEQLGFLGVAIDPDANAAIALDRDITAPGAPVRTLVIEAREDLQIARETRSRL